MVEAQGAVLPKDTLHDRPNCAGGTHGVTDKNSIHTQLADLMELQQGSSSFYKQRNQNSSNKRFLWEGNISEKDKFTIIL